METQGVPLVTGTMNGTKGLHRHKKREEERKGPKTSSTKAKCSIQGRRQLVPKCADNCEEGKEEGHSRETHPDSALVHPFTFVRWWAIAAVRR